MHWTLKTSVLGLFGSDPSVPDFSFSFTGGINLQSVGHVLPRTATRTTQYIFQTQCHIHTYVTRFDIHVRPLRPPDVCLPSQSSEDVLDIGVITSRFRDGDT